ncbi:MAG: hypothetical protein AAF608_05260 [Pseudomonadota bacterium]
MSSRDRNFSEHTPSAHGAILDLIFGLDDLSEGIHRADPESVKQAEQLVKKTLDDLGKLSAS